MAKKPYVILIASQKGGVGKTTVAVNLGTALKYQKYDVLLIDTDRATYSISEHLGINGIDNSYTRALNGEIDAKEAVFSYEPLDLNLILGGQDDDEKDVNPEKLNRFYAQVMKLGYDFVIIDCHPGLFEEPLSKYINDVAILTTPDATSAKSSAKLAKYCERQKLTHRLVINRSGSSKFELASEDIEKLYGDVVSVVIPEDQIVQESARKHKPAYIIDRGSTFSLAIEELARTYVLRVGKPESQGPDADREERKSFFEKLGGWTLGSR